MKTIESKRKSSEPSESDLFAFLGSKIVTYRVLSVNKAAKTLFLLDRALDGRGLEVQSGSDIAYLDMMSLEAAETED